MSYMNIIGKDEITRRKTRSDLMNNTENETFTNSEKVSSHGKAAKKVRDRKDALEIKALETQTEKKELDDMYNEILKGLH